MPNESTELQRKGKPVITRTLLPIAWALWGVLVIATLYGLFRVLTERTTSPEAGRGLGVMAVGLVLIVLLALAAGLYALGRRQSTGGLIALSVVLAWPLFVLIARPIVLGIREARSAREAARTGDFRDPAMAAMARAIAQDDTATLAHLLGGKPPGDGTDEAGHDLLAYALLEVCAERASANVVRLLLEAGADARRPRMVSGHPALHYLVIYSGHDGAREALRLLLEHGADPDVLGVDSLTPLGGASSHPEVVRILVEHGANIDRVQAGGVPPLVRFIGQQHWESALYLIEKGANLDIANEDGLSVDYYLKDWQHGVYGAQDEGWNKVREAIAARRAVAR